MHHWTYSNKPTSHFFLGETVILEAEGIGKEYRLGESFDSYATLRESLSGGLQRLANRCRQRFENSPTSAIDNAHDENLFWALKDVSFSVSKGEVVGIVGRNGAGKSTLLKVLTRITEPTRGRCTIAGRMGSLLEVGTGFHPEMTGRENVFLNGAILGMSNVEIRRKFDEIVEFAGVERFLDTAVKRYSSGMYVRLAFAVAAHLEPEILVVDEVLAVGDAAFQKKCLGKMQEVGRSGRTVLFVSHNMAAVRSLCTRALMLEDGRLTMDGQPEDVIDRYLKTDQSVGGVKEIPEDAERITNGAARHRQVALTAIDGTPASQLYYGQPFEVSFECDIFETVPDAHFEVSISNIDGTHIVYCTNQNSDSGEFKLQSHALQAGTYRVTARFDSVLLPRLYAIDLGIHRSDGETLDYVPRASLFEVLRCAQGDDDNYPWRSVRGHVRTNAQWRHECIAPLTRQAKPQACEPLRCIGVNTT